MNASTAMTREVLTVEPRQLLAYAWSVMVKEGIRHLPVVTDGRLVGVISDRDVLARSSLDGEMLFVPTMRIEQAMTKDVITAGPETTIASVCDTMLSNRIDCLPIVDESRRVVGLLTSSDLLFLLRMNEQTWASRAIPFEFAVRLREPPEVPQVALGIDTPP